MTGVNLTPLVQNVAYSFLLVDRGLSKYNVTTIQSTHCKYIYNQHQLIVRIRYEKFHRHGKHFDRAVFL